MDDAVIRLGGYVSGNTFDNFGTLAVSGAGNVLDMDNPFPVNNNGVISFVDLDLDIRMWPDGHTELLDEDEFIAHAALFNYPPEMRRKAWEAVDQVMALWRAKTPPFNR